MKATCKLCGQELETAPDDNLDEGRQTRERKAFYQMIARHVDPNARECHADIALKLARKQVLDQDNGWFQRWRLSRAVEIDTKAAAGRAEVERIEEMRKYSHAITRPPDPEPPPPDAAPQQLQ